MQPAALATAQQMRKHFQRQRMCTLPRRERRRHPGLQEQGIARHRITPDQPGFHRLGRRWRTIAPCCCPRGNAAVMLVHQPAHFIFRHGAADHQRCIGRRVKPRMKPRQIISGNGANLIFPANNGPSSPMLPAPKCCRERLPEPCPRVGIRPLLAFFQHHATLTFHEFLRDQGGGHAVRLHLQDQAKARSLHRLMVCRHVTRGEGIVIAAFPRDQPREIANPDLWAALEHHMFQEMRGPRTSRRVFRPTRRIEQILRDHRRAAEGNEGNLQPIGQAPMLRAK